MALCILFWSILSLIKRSMRYMTGELVSSIIVVLFMIHPNVVKNMLTIFSCTQIEGEWWLIDEQNIQCWDSEHVKYVVRLALPALIGWGIGMPAVCLFLLIKNKNDLQNPDMKLKYGYLYIGYNLDKAFYWEFIIMYRKILVAFVSVFLSSISVTVQGLLAFFIIMVSLLL